MGLVYADVRRENLLRLDLGAVTVGALVASGAINLCVPAEIAAQRDLKTRQKRLAGMADGSPVEVDMVAPMTVSENHETTTALLTGDELLLGAIPIKDLGVLIDPRCERLVLPPDRPNFALSKVK